MSHHLASLCPLGFAYKPALSLPFKWTKLILIVGNRSQMQSEKYFIDIFARLVWLMNRYAILALTIAFSSVLTVSGTTICDNAPCEPVINTNLGKEFPIALESNPSTGFEWWTKFDPNYLSLSNTTFVSGNVKSGIVGVPGKEIFSFNAKNAGDTDVIMLLLNPWENGTIAERKIFPVNIVATTVAPKQAIILGKSLGSMTTSNTSNDQVPMISHGTSATYFKNESIMETPSQAVSQSESS